MNQDTKALQAERAQLYSDFFNNRIPHRMPVSLMLPNDYYAHYGNIDSIDAQYNVAKLKEAVLSLSEKIYSDSCPYTPVNLVGTRPPMIYQILGSQSFVMGKNGNMQHPEVSGMEDSEYAELIDHPLDFLIEKVIPRQYKNLNFIEHPVTAMRTFYTAQQALNDDTMASLPAYGAALEAQGYYPGAPMGSGTWSEAPFDFVADQLRGFSGTSKDIRRHRSELKEAAEAVLPLVYHWGLPDNPHSEGCVMMPLHMPTFMREKDFADLWFPTFKTMLEQLAAKGVRALIYCEDDWMRYLDYLYELPAGTRMWFEYGDPQTIKDKLGKKHLIQGLYPLSMLKQGTPQECVDKAKDLLDIMLPGGGYLFDFDKMILTHNDAKLENLIALTEFLRDYAVYDNAGEAFGTPLNSEGFVFSDTVIRPVTSRYMANGADFLAANPLASKHAGDRYEQIGRAHV